jgi:hypothetical protein
LESVWAGVSSLRGGTAAFLCASGPQRAYAQRALRPSGLATRFARLRENGWSNLLRLWPQRMKTTGAIVGSQTERGSGPIRNRCGRGDVSGERDL